MPLSPSLHAAPDRSEGIRQICLTLLLSLVAALLSVAIQGFLYGADNNYFHLPILYSLWDDPNFASDAYVQSLRYYVSSFWVLVRMLCTESNAPAVFLVLHVLSRTLAMGGLLSCSRLLGVSDFRSRVALALIFALGTPALGDSAAGNHSLFINVFAHSEFANGLVLFALYFLLSGRIAVAFALNGVIFSINAFMGVWDVAPFGLGLAAMWVMGRVSWRTVWRQALAGVAVFLVLALPTVFWIVQAGKAAGRYEPFDYVEFLRYYWPFHFLFDEIPMAEKWRLANLALTAAAGFGMLGPKGRPWLGVVSGYALLYAVGIAVPHLTHSISVLNLHLLRAGGFFHLLAFVAMAVLAVRWWRSERMLERALYGPVLTVILCGSSRLEPLYLPLLLAAAVTGGVSVSSGLVESGSRVVRWGAVFLVAFFAARHAVNNHGEKAARQGIVEPWYELSHWAREHTAAASVFLLPVGDIVELQRHPQRFSPESLWFQEGFSFETEARRPVWVTFKAGAAVMWQPSFYPEWRQRTEAVMALQTNAERLEYARKNGIPYVVLRRFPDDLPLGAELVHENAALRLVKINPEVH